MNTDMRDLKMAYKDLWYIEEIIGDHVECPSMNTGEGKTILRVLDRLKSTIAIFMERMDSGELKQ